MEEAAAAKDKAFILLHGVNHDGKEEEELLGCVRVLPLPIKEDGRKMFEFGPYAVSPDAQGKGVGIALLEQVEAFAREHGAVALQIDVVNHRTDLFPYYGRRGFVKVGTHEFYSNFDVTAVTRPTHFVLLEKPL